MLTTCHASSGAAGGWLWIGIAAAATTSGAGSAQWLRQSPAAGKLMLADDESEQCALVLAT